MHIRRARADDIEEWLRMRNVLWPQAADVHRAEIREWLARPDAVALVAVRADGSRLAGFAEVGSRSVVDEGETSPVAYLEGWYVDPDARRRGVGSALVRAAEAWAREHGYREFGSDVELDNVVSQRAHAALGFRETSRAVNYIKTV
jgi:aminoglycoside 6'-N-acetyltransferase I